MTYMLTRACYYVMPDEVPFDVDRAFGLKEIFFGWDGTVISL